MGGIARLDALQDWERCPKSGFRTAQCGYSVRKRGATNPCRQSRGKWPSVTTQKGTVADGLTPPSAPPRREGPPATYAAATPKTPPRNNLCFPRHAAPNFATQDTIGPDCLRRLCGWAAMISQESM